jgi:hypothetical protein
MNIKDISDISPDAQGRLALPIRSEKQVMTTPVTSAQASAAAHTTSDYKITPLHKLAYKDYVNIRIGGRGGSQTGVFDPTSAVGYWFLINPSEVQINRETVEEQSFSRGGWQIGLFGENFINITLNGKTPGKYFTKGLTDVDAQFSQSYRNLMALELLYENNGYWWEGEEIATSLSALQSTKRIKMHSDVELTVGEFTWHGLFESFEVTEDADAPFLADFSLVFTGWKERFNKSTPYPGSLGGDVQRGHVPRNTAVQQLLQNVVSQAPVATEDVSIATLIMNPTDEGFNQ